MVKADWALVCLHAALHVQ